MRRRTASRTGRAQQNWGDVKHLKSGQHAHLSSDMISKAATIYGAACAKLGIEESPLLNEEGEPVVQGGKLARKRASLGRLNL